MRVHRGSLFWGIFFLLLGGIPLAARQGLIDVAFLPDIGRLWPLAIIALGVAILVSRTQLALLGTIFAALVLGTLAGGAIAGGGFGLNLGDCGGEHRANMQQFGRNGTLDAGAAVDLRFSCGTLDLTMGSGNGWNLDAAYRGDAPAVESSAGHLSVRTPSSGSRRHEWTLEIPREQVHSIDIRHNAGSARLDLTGAQLSSFKLEANAGDVTIAAADATLHGLDLSVNAGRVRLTLDGATDGALLVNAGSLDLCVPDDAELRLTVHDQLTFATNLDDRDLSRSGDLWQRAGRGGPVIQLDVSGNAASFDLDPNGGCR